MRRRVLRKRVNRAAWLYLPAMRWQRYFVAFVLLAIGLFWLPALVVVQGASLVSTSSNSDVQIDSLAEPIPYTHIEAQLAKELLADGAVMSGAAPIWDAPDDGGYFSVSRGASGRGALDSAISTTRAIRALLDSGKVIDSPEVSALIASAQAQFDIAAAGQGRDRGAFLYHRALLDIWRGNRATAIDDLSRLLQLISEIETTRALTLTPAQRRRIGGVKVATLYARALAQVSLGVPDEEARNAAIADLRAARDQAAALEHLGASARGPFVELTPQYNLVSMSTAPIWNDLIVLMMRSGGGSRQALQEVASLVENPSYVQANPTLASNLMALAAVGEGDASVAERQALVRALGAPLRLPDETPAQAETRLRAAAVYAIVGLSLPDDIVPRDPNNQSVVRLAFKQVFPGSASFNPIDLPRVRRSAQRLDSWLFIRQWRELLAAGALERFDHSYADLRGLDGDLAVDPTFFDRWRSEIDPVIDRRITRATQMQVQGAEQRRALFRYAIFDADRPTLSRILDALRYAAPGWWWLVFMLGWVASSLFAIFLVVVLRSARKVFEPKHYLARLRAQQAARVRAQHAP